MANKESNGIMIWGCVSTVCYMALAVFFQAMQSPLPLTHQQKIPILFTTLPLLLLAYWRAHIHLEKTQLHIERMFGLTVLFAVVFGIAGALVPNFDSNDIQSYMVYGQQQVQYHANPYVTRAGDMPFYLSDPLLKHPFPYFACPYGFSFVWLTKLIREFAGPNVPLMMAMFKALNVVAYGCIGALIYSIAERFKNVRADVAAFLWLWNPLVILQGISNIHNDMLMMLFVMLGIWLCTRRQFELAMVATAFGALIKLLWLPFFAFLLVVISRTVSVKRAVICALIAAATAGVISYPYLKDVQNFHWLGIRLNVVIERSSLSSTILDVIAFLGHVKNTADVGWFAMATQVVHGALFIAFVIFAMRIFVRFVRERSGSEDGLKFAVTDMTVIAAVYALVVASLFHPWYMIALLPTALLAPIAVRQPILWVTNAQIFGVTMLGTARIANFLLLTAAPAAAWFGLQRRHRSSEGVVSHEPA